MLLAIEPHGSRHKRHDVAGESRTNGDEATIEKKMSHSACLREGEILPFFSPLLGLLIKNEY